MTTTMFFNDVKTLEDLKKEYKKLVRQYHPDLHPELNGDEIKEINNQYEKLFNELKNKLKQDNYTEYNKVKNKNVADFMNIINDLIKYPDLIIDIVGSWIWVSGKTYPVKEHLKDLNFSWSKTRKMWYYATTGCGYSKHRLTYEQIKDIYGCKTISSNDDAKLLLTV